MLRFLTIACLVSLSAPLLADDPPPKPPVVTITAPKDVTGTGTRDDPFVFTTSTKCVLTLSADIKPEDWDLLDAPADIEPIGKSLVFSLAKSGSFQAIAKTPYARCWFMIKSGTDPPVPPGPVDPPGPVPEPPGPTPDPTGFRAIFIYKATANLSREQYNILYSTKIVEYLNRKCVKATLQTPAGTMQQPEWRKWKPTVTITEKESPTMVAMWRALDQTKIADKLPQLAIMANGKTDCFPLPATEAATLELLKKYGGE